AVPSAARGQSSSSFSWTSPISIVGLSGTGGPLDVAASGAGDVAVAFSVTTVNETRTYGTWYRAASGWSSVASLIDGPDTPGFGSHDPRVAIRSGRGAEAGGGPRPPSAPKGTAGRGPPRTRGPSGRNDARGPRQAEGPGGP